MLEGGWMCGWTVGYKVDGCCVCPFAAGVVAEEVLHWWCGVDVWTCGVGWCRHTTDTRTL
jgi:hypothetical protein